MARIKLRIQRPWIPYIILVSTLVITCIATYYTSRSTHERDRLRFMNGVTQTQSIITNQLEIYTTLLRGTAGLFAENPDVTKAGFQTYINRLFLQEKYKGIQGIGYIAYVPADQKESFLQDASAKTETQVTIRPAGDRKAYYAVEFLGPIGAMNQAGVGVDIGTDSARRAAMNYARDRGLPTISHKTILNASLTQPRQPGFFIFAPIYASASIPETLTKRREKILGFVFSPFRANTLFNTVVNPSSIPSLNFKIYDGTHVTNDKLLYDSSTKKRESVKNYQPVFNETKQVTVNGAMWTILYTNTSDFDSASQANLPPFIFLGGLLISIMFFMLSRAQYIARANAEISAHQLQISQMELQKAIGMRDNFISIASHELKTPVTSLKVYTEVLLKRFRQKGETKTSDYLVKMNKQIDKLTLLIVDLLDVSRLQAGHLTFRFEKFDLAEVIAEAVENTQYIAERHKIIVRGTTIKKVWGDRDRIGQVLNNLLTNGIKYSPNAKQIIISFANEKKGVRVSVQDFGIGISKEHQKKIFNRFYRVTDPDEKTYPGLGIGLYISNEIMKRHGSNITIESVKDKGSNFSFILPHSQKVLEK